jgi:hypothetical protein
MRQKIFDLPLPVETISLYLLCCALADAGTPISTHNLRAKWNAGEAALQAGLSALVARNILSRKISDQQGHDIYCLMDSDQWKTDP